MTRVITEALVASGLAGFLLLQLEHGFELAAWEGLLLIVLIALLHRIPSGPDDLDPPLWDVGKREPRRLPRAVAATELAVAGAVNQRLGTDRRLAIQLRRVARHRLARHGIDLETSAARDRLGGEAWDAVVGERGEELTVGDLEIVVERLEQL